MSKPRYVVERKGRWYWQANKAMKRAGMVSETLPEGKTAAFERAAVLNAQWDAIRQAQTAPDLGTFAALIDQFQRDPVWYGGLAKVTQAEVDLAFRAIAEKFGPHRVSIMERRHGRAFYNQMRVDQSAHKAAKVMKWFHRLLEYALETGHREYNPLRGLRKEALPGRSQVWHPDQIAAVIAACIDGGRAHSGNLIPPRPSIALAIQLAYDTAQRQQDILAMTWSQYDGQGVELVQKKTGKRLWVPLSDDTRAMLPAERSSTHIVVSEQTGRPYGKDAFTRIFRKFCQRAGIPDELQFRDLRRTAATELGNMGASETEIVSITGHQPGSSVIRTYVKPDQRAALRGARKRSR